jgi:hypothetical protein
MTFTRNRRFVAAIVAAACTAVPAAASADSLPSTFRSDAAQSGAAGSPSTDRSDAAQAVGAQSERAVTFPPAGFRGGDTPADHASSSAAPATIEVVRPERTIVRDVDEALPLILSSSALLLVLAGGGIALARTRTVRRAGAGR